MFPEHITVFIFVGLSFAQGMSVKFNAFSSWTYKKDESWRLRLMKENSFS